MSAGWLDSHCHLNAGEFDEDREDVLARARDAGVDTLVVIGAGYGVEATASAVALADPEAGLFATVGVHPHDADQWNDAVGDRLRHWLDAPGVVAVGECGLDYYYENSPRAEQRTALAAQLGLARERDLPVSIHVRDRGEDAYEELLALWESEGGGRLRGVLHCYTHTEAFAHRALDRGLEVSFSGILTFKRDRGLREVARALPLERLLVETDAPLLAPEGHRGQRNEPAWVVRVGRVLAELHGVPEAQVAAITAANARALFGLPS